MKVVVTANKLNVRKTPVIDFAKKSNIVGVIVKDSIHESTEQHENSLGVWHKIDDGWVSEKWLSEVDVSSFQPTINKAGVNVQKYIDERFDGTNLKQVIDYNFLLNIPEEIKKTKGINAVIGIMDVPISTNMKFGTILRPGNMIADKISFFHSNFIAGIIGSTSASTIMGICSKATIIDLALFDTTGHEIDDDNYFIKLINCIESINNKVIINISYSSDDYLKVVLDKFSKLKNVFFVCSAGTDDDLQDIDGCLFVNSNNAFSVGTASQEYLKINASGIDERLDFILPILNYTSFDSKGDSLLKKNDGSSSWATSVITCIISLLFSSGKLNNSSTKEEIVTLVNGLSNNFIDSYNFLNPLNYKK